MKTLLLTCLKVFLIIANLVAAIYAGALMRPIYRMQIFTAFGLYDELQENQLIDTNRFKTVFPGETLTGDSRYDVPLRLIRDKIQPWNHQYILAGIFAFNALIIGLFFPRKHRAEQAVPGYPPQGVGSPEP